MSFEPSSEVATPNLPASNQTVTTHVDHTYPFCEPSNRNNTTLDFYHLLLFGTCAPNKEQVFTNFGTQECGDFLKETDIHKPLGHCVSHVYRSWAFVQRQLIEEFTTDDGYPYWYDRRTGHTFWERPLMDIETMPVTAGGTRLSGATSDSNTADDAKKKYRQDDVRKLILKKHETADEMLDRRRVLLSAPFLSVGRSASAWISLARCVLACGTEREVGAGLGGDGRRPVSAAAATTTTTTAQ
jgi:hypothetical protein